MGAGWTISKKWMPDRVTDDLSELLQALSEETHGHTLVIRAPDGYQAILGFFDLKSRDDLRGFDPAARHVHLSYYSPGEKLIGHLVNEEVTPAPDVLEEFEPGGLEGNVGGQVWLRREEANPVDRVAEVVKEAFERGGLRTLGDWVKLQLLS